ncbi:MAG TPA: hypothetical protein VLV45_01960 [Gemmatimonadales bacterium]|nr:hypothetical protein [Gemmatimonadales bacterium]
MATRVPAQDGKGDLARLLATEERLEQMVARARLEAERMVAEARAQAAAHDAATGAELDRAVREMSDRVARDQAQRAAALATARAAEAARFDSISDAQIAELARYVVRRVIGGVAEPA